MTDSGDVKLTPRFYLAAAAAFVHLVLVACGAARVVPVSESHWLGRAIEIYRSYSGANNGYGFYAPGVASEWRASFEICDGERKRCLEIYEEPPNREISLLLSTIDGLFAFDEFRDLVAASWAGTQFARYPQAEVVVVKAQVFVVPTMAEHRAGQKPRWLTAHVFAFTKVQSR